MGELTYNGYGIEDADRIGAMRQLATLSGSLSDKERDGLGNLFAASPAMLKALEEIYTDDDGDGYISAEGMAEIRALIALAKGDA